jgi:hypothetical protein
MNDSNALVDVVQESDENTNIGGIGTGYLICIRNQKLYGLFRRTNQRIP